MANLKGVKAAGHSVHPHDDLVMHVNNQSSRNGIRPHLIVLHDTESKNLRGLNDLRSVGNWFNNPASDASAHVATDAEGHSARFVEDERKAWSCVDFNSRSLNIEQIGFAKNRRWTDAELLETARWIARWSIKYDIPIQRATFKNGWRGVARHSDLGVAGGAHHDPGAPYPFDDVLRVARGFVHLIKGSK